MKYILAVGQRFRRLTVLNCDVNARVQCLCDCGTVATRTASELVKNKTASCGCAHRELLLSGKMARNSTHGHSNSPTWTSWKGMHQRCRLPTHNRYHRYGGRGIKVCERWSDFANFLADMGERPSPLHSIDRKDNDCDYSPDNCRWATSKQQAANRSTTKRSA